MKIPKQILLSALCGFAVAHQLSAQPALTVYNQNFAVVRDTVPMELKEGVNRVQYSDITTHVETDSVILRDPSGKNPLQVLEQNYRNDPVSQGMLLSLNEGKTIDFQVDVGWGEKKIVQGKIIRSGYVPHSQETMQRYGQRYSQGQMAYSGPNGMGQPVIEVNGKLQFSLPGQPIFPALADDTILKPMLDWQIQAAKPGKLDAELAYITGGMTWEADYNIVAPEKSDTIDLVGWVTLDNQSGKTFENAKIKLMAGDVSKIQRNPYATTSAWESSDRKFGGASKPVTEKSFDEYHLYTLQRPATLHDRETKQIEFIRAAGVKSQRVYVYDGLKLNENQRQWDMENIRNNENYGTECSKKVAVMREFKNSEANHLGMPLPKGRLRFYKQDDSDKQLEFTGENEIDHTPKDETVRVFTGNAFDIVGERIRTNYKIDSGGHWADESFEIKLRNHKKEPVEVRIVEHLYRWYTWEITAQSDPSVKTSAQTMEFRVQLKPDEEKTVTYTVHYTW